MSVPFVNPEVAERLFRTKALAFLKADGFLSKDGERFLLSSLHATGFSVDASVKAEPEDADLGMEGPAQPPQVAGAGPELLLVQASHRS